MSRLKNKIELFEKMLADNDSTRPCTVTANIKEQLFNTRHIVDLWNEFGDIPLDPALETIEQEWHGFPAGTHRETIWHWFESYFGISVAEDLMY